MQEALLYYNPTAGRQPVSRLRLSKIRELLYSCGIHCSAVASRPRAEGPPRLDLEGKQLLIAMGGDGTIHELLPLAVRHRLALGILPSGTANVLAAELGIPGQIERAVRILRDNRRRRMSLGKANGEYFHLMAGIGLDARVILNTPASLKRSLGKPAYWLGGVRSLLKLRPESFELNIDGSCRQAAFAVISNCHYYGGRLQVTPAASPFSNHLDVCLFEGSRRADYLRYWLGVLARRHLRFRDVRLFRATRVDLLAEDSVPVQLDGDAVSPTPTSFEIEVGALEVVVPSALSAPRRPGAENAPTAP